MRSVESSAKTMEEAVTQGLEKLGVSFADVKIDILDEGSKGFLGILGGKPVVVRLTVREDVEEGEDFRCRPSLWKMPSRSRSKSPPASALPGPRLRSLRRKQNPKKPLRRRRRRRRIPPRPRNRQSPRRTRSRPGR